MRTTPQNFSMHVLFWPFLNISCGGLLRKIACSLHVYIVLAKLHSMAHLLHCTKDELKVLYQEKEGQFVASIDRS